MPKIRFLDDALISKIAAGEVIERPSSVVKELIENSLDANAHAISVSIEDGGRARITVTDDGEGMDEEDCKLCIGRHATSKLRTQADLFSIGTLGFRGEALASIAAIADMTITSRIRSSPEATIVRVSRGQATTQKAGAPTGTEITIQSLFSHTPARKKYLKSASTEAAMVADVVTRFALFYPQHHFQLFHNNHCLLNTSPANEWIERIADLYGHDLAKGLLPVYHQQDKYTIRGFVSKPALTRQDRRCQHLAVNARWVKSKVVSDAIQTAYGRLLFHDRYPLFILQIDLPFQQVDVNVHPTKKEVRFLEEQKLCDLLVAAVSTTLQAYDLTPSTTIAADHIKPTPAAHFVPDTTRQETLSFVPEEETSFPFVIKGCIHDCFWIVEDEHGMMLVDQHAADERVNYETLASQFNTGGIAAQQLLEPVMITVPPHEVLLFSQKLPELEQFGFIVEAFGTNTLIVRSSPVVMGRQQTKDLLLDLVSELSHIETGRINEIKDNIIARMACRKSVKKGDKVEPREMYAIMKRLLRTKTPYTCPHGRPTMITLSEHDLEKKFKRCG